MGQHRPVDHSGKSQHVLRVGPTPVQHDDDPGRALERGAPVVDGLIVVKCHRYHSDMESIVTAPRRLRNFVAGEWVEGTGKQTELFHAVTGEKVAETSTGGIAFGTKGQHRTQRVAGA